MNIKKSYLDNRTLLLKIIGQLIKEKRLEKKKGIILFGFEYDISNSSIAMLEKGKRDVQITTLWKIANALGMTFSEFVNEVEKRLPEKFKLVDE